MDAEDFDDIEDYWAALIEHQGLCGKCYAGMDEHEEDEETGKMICPE